MKFNVFSYINAALLFSLKVATAELQIGAYYYPWYSDADNGYKHWIDGYARAELSSPQLPLLGEYNSFDPEVIDQHIRWAKDYGIDFFMSSWWGPGTNEDIVLKNNVTRSTEFGDFKYCILYESLAGDRATDTPGTIGEYKATDGLIYFNNEIKRKLISDFEYMRMNYFNDPNYLKVNGSPAVFFYVSRVFRGEYANAFAELRQLFRERYDITLYLVGDNLEWENKTDFDLVSVFDAVTSYTMYSGPQDQREPSEPARLRHSDESWFLQDVALRYDYVSKKASEMGVNFVPGCQPGFNDRGLNDAARIALDNYVLSHERNTTTSNENTLFRDFLELAGKYVDEEVNLLAVTSWNEWHEDTQLEPTQTGPISDNPNTPIPTSQPHNITLGQTYHSYGFDLLEILKAFKDSYVRPETLTKQADIVISEIGVNIENNIGASYIELYNKTSQPVSLNNWRFGLQNFDENFDRSFIPLDGIIPPNGYYTIATTQYESTIGGPISHVDRTGALVSKIEKDERAFGLRDSKGIKVDGIAYHRNLNFEHIYLEGQPFRAIGLDNNESISRNVSNRDTENNSVDFSVRNPSYTYTPWTGGPIRQDLLRKNETLNVNDFNYVPSLNKYLMMQGDGNLVLYNGTTETPGAAAWASGTIRDTTDHYVILQNDGNLVIYTGAGSVLWQSGRIGSTDENYFLTYDESNRTIAIYTGTPNSPNSLFWRPALSESSLNAVGEIEIDEIAIRGGKFSITIPEQDGIRYSLWKTDNLESDSWTRVGEAPQSLNSGMRTLTDENTLSRRMFYRIQIDE